ncbi:IS1595 family transposase [Paenibacillus qinlingensis]|uniref:Transposase-like protein n=1 Tax=Paenibacillus qinlingensis TaxID=1837343 RepID=A0ABU1NVD2_9BACL|nr:IS1595 family transposase [Paenibacillus qinlingensis]MDR6551046.1 transposase-like protein [Paenibacillus qinlingensis]
MDMCFVDSLDDTFQTEEDCEMFLMKNRWANGFCCPRCDHDSFYKVKTRSLLECKECRTQVSITTGTVMHKSKLSLLLWFKAIRLLIQDDSTYSIPTFAGLLGVNYRTAKLMIEKIQLALYKQYACRSNKKLVNPLEITIEEDGAQSCSENETPKSAQPKGNTSVLAAYLFKTRRNIRYEEQDMFRKWMNGFFSVRLYPHFLRYFQL